jgi:hypothetical protein
VVDPNPQQVLGGAELGAINQRRDEGLPVLSEPPPQGGGKSPTELRYGATDLEGRTGHERDR